MDTLQRWIVFGIFLAVINVIYQRTGSKFANSTYPQPEIHADLPLSKQKELTKLQNYMKMTFLQMKDVEEVISGVKKFQAAYKLTDEEIIDSFYYARLTLVFHWDVEPVKIIAQLMFVLEKYVGFVETFCTNPIVYDRTIQRLRKLPHLLNANLGKVVHKFLSQLTISCNKHFPAFEEYRNFLKELFDKYLNTYMKEDLMQRDIYKGMFHGFLNSDKLENNEPLYDIFLKGFFEGIINPNLDPKNPGIEIIML